MVKETFGQILLLEREGASGEKWMKVPVEIMLCRSLSFSGLNIGFEMFNLPREDNTAGNLRRFAGFFGFSVFPCR